MGRWRKRRDEFRQDGSPEDLADVNEQELAKDLRRMGDAGDYTQWQSDVNISLDKDKKSGGANNTDVGNTQIVRSEQSREIYKDNAEKEITRSDKSHADGGARDFDADEFVNFEKIEDFEDADGDDGKKRREREDAKNVFYRSVIALSMLVSILVFAFVLYGAYFEESDDAITPELNGSQNDVPQAPQQAGDRIVYIRDFDEDSGVLSAAEIYSKNGQSVVTVVAEGEASESIGTGFVLSSDGYVVTASHTVEGADRLTVVSQDGERVEAEVVGRDAISDIALLRVYTDGLVGVELGNSDELLVGDRIIAIGTPYSEEFSGSVFSGSVSNCSRTVSIYDEASGRLEKKMNFVQLSATLGKGCSGCPVFDEFGRVIGILSARLGDGTNGVCFAIPINGAVGVIEALKRDGVVSDEAQNAVASPAPKLGALGEVGERDGVRGVLISDFSSADCDAALKLKRGDIITEIEGREISLPSDVSNAINKHNSGDCVSVTVYRAGQYLTFDVELTE